MDIEEKRKIVQRYCDHAESCFDCVLNDRWLDKSKQCRTITDATEKELDEAIMYIDGQKSAIKAINALEAPVNRPADMVHKPEHYTYKSVECKDIIKVMAEGLKGEQSYYVGAIIKYLYRYPKKGNSKQDLEKAAEYLKLLTDAIDRK